VLLLLPLLLLLTVLLLLLLQVVFPALARKWHVMLLLPLALLFVLLLLLLPHSCGLQASFAVAVDGAALAAAAADGVPSAYYC